MADLSLDKKPMALFGAALAVLALAVFAAGFMTGLRYGENAGDEARTAQAQAPAPEAEQVPAKMPPEAEKAGPKPETREMKPERLEPEELKPSLRAANETAAELEAPERAPVPGPNEQDTTEPVEVAEVPRNATIPRAEPEIADEAVAEAPAREPTVEESAAEEPAVKEPPAHKPAPETDAKEPARPAVEKQTAEEAVEPGPSGAGYLVQAASFRSRERALEMADELGAEGSSSGVIRVFDSEGQPWYVVHVGWYKAYDEAMAAGSEYESRRGASFTVREMDAEMLRNRTVRAEKEGAGG